MATDLERLTVRLEANFKQYEKELARANKLTVSELRKVEKESQRAVSGIEKRFGSLGSSIRSGLGSALAGVSFAAVIAAGKNAIAEIADIGDAADRIGVAAEDLQKLGKALEQNGGQFSSAAELLDKFNQEIGEASRGGTDLAKILEANGVAIRNADGSMRPLIDLFKDYARLVQNAGSQQERAVLATAAFGRSGRELLSVLSQGPGVLDQFAAGVTNQGVKSMQELDDKMKEITRGVWEEFQRGVVDLTALFNALSGSVSSTNAELTELAEWSKYLDGLAEKYGPFGSNAQNGFFGLFGGQKPASTPLEVTVPGGGLPVASTGTGTTILPSKSTSSGPSAEAKAAEARAAAIQRVVSALQFESEQLRLNALQQKINTELRTAGVSATSAQGQEIAKLVTANYNFEASQRLATQALSDYNDRLEAIKSAQLELAQTGYDAFKRIAIGGEDAVSVLEDLAAQIADAAFQAALFGSGPLATLLGGGTSGGGILGTLLGGASGIGLYAKGGQIPSGKLGIAGEGGMPELIKGPATVIPMSRVSGGGKTQVSINVNLSGANGDRAVRDIAAQGVREGLREYSRRQPEADVERRLRFA